MTLQLDARQRAMLGEMGVLPAYLAPLIPIPPTAPSNTEAGVAAPKEVTPSVVAPSTPVREAAPPAPARKARTEPVPPVTPPTATLPIAVQRDVSQLDLPALREAAASCQDCALAQARQHSVWAPPPAPANDPTKPRWLFVLDQPGAAENASGLPAQGDSGVLLANMAKAIGLSPEQVLVSHVTRCAPTRGRASKDEVQQCATWLQREIALLQPNIIMALGPQAAWSLLRADSPLGQLRGSVHHVANTSHIPVIVSYPLDYLLRTPKAKAATWQDLCLALAQTPTM